MAASRNDQAILSVETSFANRVRQSIVALSLQIIGETTITGPGHAVRARLATQIVQNPDAFKQSFAFAVACDANVVGDATVAGTIALTTGNVVAQQALITDAHLDAATQTVYGAFITT